MIIKTDHHARPGGSWLVPGVLTHLVPSILVACLVAVGGCYADDEGTLPVYDPAGHGFFDFPFPSNHRLDSDGLVQLGAFPDLVPDIVELYV